MPARFYNQAPPVLVVLVVCSLLVVLLSRDSFVAEEFPAFLPLNANFLHVELIGDDITPGVYQINDGFESATVIDLTIGAGPDEWLPRLTLPEQLQDGESLQIVKKELQISYVQRGWMPAAYRVALGIPLHPDRMSYEDWQFLPGLGVALATEIEKNRQINGDYASLEGLLRVKGIGEKSIERWRKFFSVM